MSVLEDVVIRRDRSVVTPSICSPPSYTLFHSSPGWRVFTFSASFGLSAQAIQASLLVNGNRSMSLTQQRHSRPTRQRWIERRGGGEVWGLSKFMYKLRREEIGTRKQFFFSQDGRQIRSITRQKKIQAYCGCKTDPLSTISTICTNIDLMHSGFPAQYHSLQAIPPTVLILDPSLY